MYAYQEATVIIFRKPTTILFVLKSCFQEGGTLRF
jgi:hypothetical protein